MEPDKTETQLICCKCNAVISDILDWLDHECEPNTLKAKTDTMAKSPAAIPFPVTLIRELKEELQSYIRQSELYDDDELCLESQNLILGWIEKFFEDKVYDNEHEVVYGVSPFRVSVQEMKESQRTTFWVCLDRGDRPLDAKPWVDGRITPFKSENKEHADIEAERWTKFLAKSLNNGLAARKAEAKLFIDANVWDGEDRSGAAGDGASFTPDGLQELVDDLVEHLTNGR